MARKVMPDFYTLQQQDNAFIQHWLKITKEDVNFESLAQEEEITYYNVHNKADTRFEYDILFHFDPNYDPKIKRCDRHNLDIVRENIYNEEILRICPVVVSHNFGHRGTNLEGLPFISHKRIKGMEGLSRRNKVNLKPDKKAPRTHGYPQIA